MDDLDDFDLYTYQDGYYRGASVKLGFYFYGQHFTIPLVMDETSYHILPITMTPTRRAAGKVINPVTLQHARLGMNHMGEITSQAQLVSHTRLMLWFMETTGSPGHTLHMALPRHTIACIAHDQRIHELLTLSPDGQSRIRMISAKELDPQYAAQYKPSSDLGLDNPEPISLITMTPRAHYLIQTTAFARLLTPVAAVIQNIKQLGAGVFADPFLWHPMEDGRPVTVQIIRGRAMRLDEMDGNEATI